ncbi:hypothetical protein F442_02043 [Phytophthora nicotianae P10297]|uniref:arabinogalactan endo-beta-1,4-galactanase n=1 Tax=Phytophthora nicotianae P10297 TaxID=1317064 RepID=W3A082_PHYNI|nr:hypothetical protein F442_02043 [Phytophthora nicotianae P10297]
MQASTSIFCRWAMKSRTDFSGQWARSLMEITAILQCSGRRSVGGMTDAVATGVKKPEIMIHVDNGWNHTTYFNDRFATGTVTPDDVDVLGFSFYPFYSVIAAIEALNLSLTQFAKDYNKPLYVVETDWPVACENVTLSENFTVSPAGQTQWVTAGTNVLEGLPHNLGAGIFYWEPGFLAVESLVA